MLIYHDFPAVPYNPIKGAEEYNENTKGNGRLGRHHGDGRIRSYRIRRIRGSADTWWQFAVKFPVNTDGRNECILHQRQRLVGSSANLGTKHQHWSCHRYHLDTLDSDWWPRVLPVQPPTVDGVSYEKNTQGSNRYIRNNGYGSIGSGRIRNHDYNPSTRRLAIGNDADLYGFSSPCEQRNRSHGGGERVSWSVEFRSAVHKYRISHWDYNYPDYFDCRAGRIPVHSRTRLNNPLGLSTSGQVCPC